MGFPWGCNLFGTDRTTVWIQNRVPQLNWMVNTVKTKKTRPKMTKKSVVPEVCNFDSPNGYATWTIISGYFWQK